MANVCLYLGFMGSVSSLICIIIAMSSPQWLQVRSYYFINDVGLMRHCDVLTSHCGDMERLNDLVDAEYASLFKSIQATFLLHCVGSLVSSIIYGLYTLNFFEAKGGFKALTLFNFLTLLAGIYTVSVYATEYRKFFGLESPDYDNNKVILNVGSTPTAVAQYGYGFFMAVAGLFLAAVVFVCSAVEASRAAQFVRNMRGCWGCLSPYTLFVDQEV